MSRSMQMTGAWHGLMAQTICNLIFTEKSWTLLFFLSELWSRAHQAVKCCIWYINSVLAVSMFFPQVLLHVTSYMGWDLAGGAKEPCLSRAGVLWALSCCIYNIGWKQGKKVERVAWKICVSSVASDLPLCSHHTMFQHITGELHSLYPLGSSIRAGQITSVLNFWTTAFWARLQRNTDHSWGRSFWPLIGLTRMMLPKHLVFISSFGSSV